MASSTSQLRHHRRVALDSMLFIYLFEQRRPWVSQVEAIFRQIETRKLSAVTSVITFHEVLIRPFRLGQTDLVIRYGQELSQSRYLEVVPVDSEVATIGARLRADYPGLRAPDALHVASGLVAGATAFVTGDQRLAGIKDLEIIQLG